jgi:nucleotide-binding universal stress UspA family protein
LGLPAKRTLEEAQRVLAHAHVKARSILEFGSPVERILALARNYDLTVAGAYGSHERKQPGLGPVSSSLLQSSTGNVMVGRELINEDNFRILVAIDSSEASLNGLQMLGSLFDPALMDVTLMHVMEMAWADASWSHDPDEGVDPAEFEEYQTQLARELRLTANAVISNAQEQLERWSVPSTPIIKDGDPALEICSEAERGGYDLVIVGATGASDVKHALLGSVSLRVAWDAPCSVAIIRRVG